MEATDFQFDTTTKLKRIAMLSSSDHARRFDSLMHHFNKASLEECFHLLDGRKAVGTDGITKENYAEQLKSNLDNLIKQMRQMAYRPGAVREVRIPKGGKTGSTRRLGISNFEDKIVQKMMQRILESIYEPLFLDCSYGFRPNRSCHDAVKDLREHLYRHKVSMVIDVDLKGFFDTIDHELLEGILRNKIKDQRFMRYMKRMFRAGMLSKGELTVSEEGVPQGSVCSPVLSNIFAHYVLDEWFEDVVKQHCNGEVAMFRYCDDVVICSQYEHDAKRIVKALTKRLSKYKLQLNEDKTRYVRFSTIQAERGLRQETFDFLGFTFYLGKTLKGFIAPLLKSSGKRLNIKLNRVKEWAKKAAYTYRLIDLWKLFCSKLRTYSILWSDVQYRAC